ncbi:pyrroline-5-carboxylate reductase dimerization-domain-containing protein [Gorgonomyces haynaldii]|nr:pyrroline-5-carboxylate reductase dimerization-domain-containing protein [Gorgonomyces haynaldii]
MESKKIGFIGGGNMANAIIGGLLKAGLKAENIIASDPWEPSRQKLQDDFKIKTTVDNNQVIDFGCDVVVFAVKPQVMKQVAQGIARSFQQKKPLVITIAAGITIPDLGRWLLFEAPQDQPKPSIVRCMPNTPALVQEGATGMYAGLSVTGEQKHLAEQILQSISKKAYWVQNEALLDVVTGVSGSGPAYFFLMVECLEQAGIDLGLPREVARGLASQTCLGAGMMLLQTGEDPAELRRKVTSPKGTTEAGIKSLEESGMREAFKKCVQRATERGAELGHVLGQQVLRLMMVVKDLVKTSKIGIPTSLSVSLCVFDDVVRSINATSDNNDITFTLDNDLMWCAILLPKTVSFCIQADTWCHVDEILFNWFAIKLLDALLSYKSKAKISVSECHFDRLLGVFWSDEIVFAGHFSEQDAPSAKWQTDFLQSLDDAFSL